MQNIRWVIQNNLGSSDEISKLIEAAEYYARDVITLEVVPFSDVVPNIEPDMPTVFYGATRWIDTIYRHNIWNPGVFFNPESTCDYWLAKYGERALNHGGEITTLKEFSKCDHAPESYFFIRPCSDQKEFPGCVLPFERIRDWSNLLVSDCHELEAIPILVAEPFALSHEWRLFIVEGNVVSGSHYRCNGRLDVKFDVPGEVIQFATERIKEYEPAPVFVMDIGLSKELYVIEVGCFNSAGFYASNVFDVVGAVSDLVARR